MDLSNFELFAEGRSNDKLRPDIRSLLQLERMTLRQLSTLETPATAPRHMKPSAGAWTHNAMADFHKDLHAQDSPIPRMRRFDNPESEKLRPSRLRELVKKYGLNPKRWGKNGTPNLGNSRFKLTDRGSIKNTRKP